MIKNEDELNQFADAMAGDDEAKGFYEEGKASLSDEELASLIRQELTLIETDSWSLLSQQRINATAQFEHTINYDHKYSEGLSNVVMNFTGPSVDTLSTYLTKIFCSDKDTVIFNPTSVEDKEAASQAMKMVNNVLHKKNNGYKVLSSCFKDAGINKNSVIKIAWSEEKESFEEEWSDVGEEELALILIERESQGYECEIVEQVEVEVDGETSSSITIKCTYTKGMPKLTCIPPEEFVINEGTSSINGDEHTRFVAHRRLYYSSEILAMFPDVDVERLPSGSNLMFDYETQSRHTFDGTYKQFMTDTGQEATRLREVVESWILADMDGNNKAMWMHCFSCGHTILSKEEWFGPIPFASFTYFPIPHKFYGLSVYDKIRDYERSATALLRSQVDSSVMANTTRLIADPQFVNMRDLQTVKNGIIQAQPGFDPSKVMMVPTSPTIGSGTEMIAQIRQQIIAEIGIDPISGQISTDVEKSGNDATKTSMVIENASAKIEGYAREFAENTLRDVIWQILRLLVVHSDDDSVKQLAEEVSPGVPFLMADALPQVINKADLTAKVGLGHMTGQQRIQAANSIMAMLETFSNDPNNPLQLPSMAKLELVYEVAKGWGYDNPELIFGTPQQVFAETEKYEQEKAMQQQMQQQQLMLQQQAQATEQQKVEAEIGLAQQDQQFKEYLQEQRTQAQNTLDEQKAHELDAKISKIDAETDRIDTETEILIDNPVEGGITAQAVI